MSCRDCSASCAEKRLPEPIGWRLDGRKILRLMAFISLVAAYFIGQALNKPTWELDIQKLYPEATIVASEALEDVWELHVGGEVLVAALATENSYGGPLTLATLVNRDGMAVEQHILRHSDTPAYIQKLKNHFFFRQFRQLPVEQQFVQGNNYDAITGATLSSNAIMRANMAATHYLAERMYGKTPRPTEESLSITATQGMLMGVIALTLINLRLKNSRLKTACKLMSLVIVGFWANQMINVANFSAIMLGFVPSLSDDLGFWILLGSVVGAIVVIGRNIYCGNICPFSAVQFVLQKVGGMNIPLHPLIQRHGKILAKVGLWAGLMVGLLTTNPTAGAYEPFAMIFSLQGEGIQWYILPAVMIGCFFIPNLFCRFLCPAGEALSLLVSFRNNCVVAIKQWGKPWQK